MFATKSNCYLGKPCSSDPGPKKFHTGVDIHTSAPNEVGEPVYAMEDGVVIGLDSTRKPGDVVANSVIIKGKDGYITIYSHVTPWFRPSINDAVKQGDIIGGIDMSGKTSDPHVHVTRLAPRSDSITPQERVMKGDFTCNFLIPTTP